jgi:hypothetical protein
MTRWASGRPNGRPNIADSFGLDGLARGDGIVYCGDVPTVPVE